MVQRSNTMAAMESLKQNLLNLWQNFSENRKAQRFDI